MGFFDEDTELDDVEDLPADDDVAEDVPVPEVISPPHGGGVVYTRGENGKLVAERG